MSDTLVRVIQTAVKEVLLSDSVNVTDAGYQFVELYRLLSSSFDVNDIASLQRIQQRVLQATLKLSDSLVAAVGKIIDRILQDNIDLQDSLQVNRDFVKLLTSSLNVTDSILKDSHFFKLLTDSTTISDALTRSIVKALYEITLKDSLNVSDSIAVSLVRALQEFGIIKFGIGKELINMELQDGQPIVSTLEKRLIDMGIEK